MTEIDFFLFYIFLIEKKIKRIYIEKFRDYKDARFLNHISKTDLFTSTAF